MCSMETETISINWMTRKLTSLIIGNWFLNHMDSSASNQVILQMSLNSHELSKRNNHILQLRKQVTTINISVLFLLMRRERKQFNDDLSLISSISNCISFFFFFFFSKKVYMLNIFLLHRWKTYKLQILYI